MRLAIAVSLSLVVACSVADMPGTTPGLDENGDALSARSATSAGCLTKLTPMDPASLTPCECKAGGKARCVKVSNLPASLSSELEKCNDDDGACVPDTIIAGGEKAVTSCSQKGKPGKCLSLCVPLVAKYAAAYLTRGDGDACPSDERCVPCENPLDGTSTGVCDIGKDPPASCKAGADAGTGIGVKPGEEISCPFTGTKADVTRFPACGEGGRCVDASLIADPRVASRLATCPTGLCVPEVYVAEKGSHLPTACTSLAGIEGRCFSTLFEDVAAEKDILPQTAQCTTTERCVPCFDPATNAPTGACSTVSCDAPKTTPPTLKDCCKENGKFRGKCIPTADVPASAKERLDTHQCKAGAELCVPTDNLDPSVPVQTCAATGGRGVCVSNCIHTDFLEDLLLDQGSCRSDQTCIPCVDPTTGQPSGAPGC
jgi:hypothetical protein